MKKVYYKIFILVIIALSSESARAQYQSLFGNSETSWNITRSNLGWTITDSVVTALDTIINNKTYKKVISYDVPSLQFPSNNTGFLREDSVLGKAWFFSVSDTVERLIMDLSLNLGDSFRVTHTWEFLDSYYPVDSIWVVSGKKHLRVNYDIEGAGEKLIFIEGIGTNAGIGHLDYSYGVSGPYLLCASKDGVSSYQNNHSYFNGICVFTTVGIEETQNNSNIKLYPNPSFNNLVIENLGQHKETITIEVRFVTGKLAIKQKVTNFQKTTINTSKIPVGVYFVTVKEKSKILTTQKWVKVE